MVENAVKGLSDTMSNKIDNLTGAFVTHDQMHLTVDPIAADVAALKDAADKSETRTSALEGVKRARRSTWALFWAGAAVSIFGGGVVGVIYELVQATQHLTK